MRTENNSAMAVALLVGAVILIIATAGIVPLGQVFPEEELYFRLKNRIGFLELEGLKLDRTLRSFERSGDQEREELAELTRSQLDLERLLAVGAGLNREVEKMGRLLQEMQELSRKAGET